MNAGWVLAGSRPLLWFGALLLLVLIGSWAAVSPTAVAVMTLVMLGCAVTWTAWRRLGCVPTNPFDAALAMTIVVLPIAPALNDADGLGTVLRFGLAALLVLLVIGGGAPLARPLWGNGRWMVLAFCLWQLVAAVSSGDPTYSAIRLLNWVMFVPVAFIAWDPKRLRVVVAACLTAAGLLLLGILLQYAGRFGGTWGGVLLPTTGLGAPGYAIRYTSFLLNPNDLGLAMLSVALAALLLAAVPGQRLAWRWALTGTAGVMTAGLVLSGSRGPLLGLPLVALYLVVVRRARTVLQLLALGGLVSATILVVSPALRASVVTNLSSVVRVVDGQDASAAGRLDVWAIRIDGADNLVIGSGYGGYAGAITADITQSAQRSALYAATTVDNTWLKLLLEEGVVGVLLLSGIFAYSLSSAVRLSWRQRTSPVGAIAGSVLVLAAFRAFSVDLLDINPWNFFVWLIVGIVLSSAAHALASGARVAGSVRAPAHPGALLRPRGSDA